METTIIETEKQMTLSATLHVLFTLIVGALFTLMLLFGKPA